jgi:hypothetical protein
MMCGRLAPPVLVLVRQAVVFPLRLFQGFQGGTQAKGAAATLADAEVLAGMGYDLYVGQFEATHEGLRGWG